MKFNKNEWTCIGRWRQPTLPVYNWDHWSQDNKFHPQFPKVSGRFIPLDGYFFTPKKDIEAMKRFFLSKDSDYKLLEQLEKWVDETHQQAIAKVNAPYGSLIEATKAFFSAIKEITNPWTFFLFADCALQPYLKETCDKKTYEILSREVRPYKDTFMMQQCREQAELHQEVIAAGIKNPSFEMVKESNPALAEKIYKHIERFRFIGIHHFRGEQYDEKQFFEGFPLRPKKEELQAAIVPEEYRWLARLLSIAAFARTYMAETTGLLTYYFLPKFDEIRKALNLQDDEHIWLSPEEMIAGLENPAAFVKPNIALRRKKVGVILEKGRHKVLAGDEVDAILSQLLETKTYRFPLHGTTACKGRAAGNARIVFNLDDSKKVKQGDILVSPETTPEFIAAMKRAAAIVTERGGMTSHAAIVAREMGVPCIVGVEGATVAIKDGQRIEVDAEKGEVRLLETSTSQ